MRYIHSYPLYPQPEGAPIHGDKIPASHVHQVKTIFGSNGTEIMGDIPAKFVEVLL
jgi:hypothetical protein